MCMGIDNIISRSLLASPTVRKFCHLGAMKWGRERAVEGMTMERPSMAGGRGTKGGGKGGGEEKYKVYDVQCTVYIKTPRVHSTCVEEMVK